MGAMLVFFISRDARENFKNYIGQDYTDNSQQAIDSIDRIIFRRLELWQLFIKDHPQILDLVKQSNRYFESVKVPEDLVAQRDLEWVSGSNIVDSDLINSVIGNVLAEDLRDLQKFYRDQYGFELFPEIFITNKYGATVLATGRTSDYAQADEDWWQKAKQDGVFVSNFRYDASSATRSLDLCIRLDDDGGNFQGVLKVVLNIQETIDVISNLTINDRTTGNSSMESYLISKDGSLIYASDDDSALAFSSSVSNILNNIKSKNAGFFVSAEDHEGAGGEVLYSFAHSRGYKGYESQGWVFIFENSIAEINSRANILVWDILLVIFILLILSFILALFVSQLIARPLEKLKQAVYRVGSGDYTLDISSKDEVGDLAIAFNDMIKTINDSRKDIDLKVEEQTKDIANKASDLEKQRLAILNILEDVQEEKDHSQQLAQDLEKFKLAVDNASDHVVITDTQGLIIYANKSVERITGFSNQEVLGKKAGSSELWGGFMGADFYKNFWDTIKNKKKPFVGEIHNRRKNGENYEAMASVSPVLSKNGEVIYFVGIERDITKEKEIDRAKSEFVSLASHQLRTPLSAINWYAEMLLHGDAGKISKEQKDYIQEIYNGNQRMIDLVNALLNVSRIELGKLAVEPAPTNLLELADSVLAELTPSIKIKALKLQKVYDKKIPVINLDPKLMRIVFQNYLSNAVKYTPEKGSVKISITQDVKKVLIAVSDTGYGVPAKQKDKIFQKLFRADNVRLKETEGTGLGLYIVKSVIEQFGGKVWFDSVEDKGSTFYATVPLKGVKRREGTKGLENTK